ncbi:MAG TPA: hypothetical protein VMU11_01225 [Verrucomicrobiae bacterium]|nr:hypothetical protein [Verrucomicrobiae bacterium]
MSRFEWTSLALQILTLVAASYFAYTQNVVNDRLARLEDYVSVSAIPDAGGIRFINTGGSNVYIDEVDVDASSTRYDKPRQIAAKADGNSSYFLPVSLELANRKTFDITLKLTDEFGGHWISQHGGGAADDDPKTGAFNVWTYQTKKAD